MPSLRMIFAVVVLYVLFVIYSVHSNAAALNAFQDFRLGNQGFVAKTNSPKFTIKVTPPGPGAAKSKESDVLGAYQNNDGTVTTAITACGSFIEVIADMATVQKQDPKVLDAANAAVKKACK